MPLKIEDRKVDGVTIVELSGRLVLGKESASLREAMKHMASRGDKKILVNLAGVNYIDSSGLGTLVGGYTTLVNSHGEMKLLHLTDRVHELMHITKLLTVFDVFTDEAAALRSFQ